MKCSEPETIVICGSRFELGKISLDTSLRILVTGHVTDLARRHQAAPKQQLLPRPRRTCRMVKQNVSREKIKLGYGYIGEKKAQCIIPSSLRHKQHE